MKNQFGIISCFVFDGIVPAAKKDELTRRRNQRQRTKERAAVKIANMMKEIEESSPQKTIEPPSSLPIDDDKKETASLELKETATAAPDAEDFEKQLAAEMAEAARQSALLSKIVEEEKLIKRDVKSEYYVELKELFKNNNIPFVQATYEGEQCASWLLKNGYADMVVSDDYDCLLCGAPVFFQHFSNTRLTPRLVFLEPLLQYLKMTHSQFVDYCTLLGTDFKGHLRNVGVKGALDIIRQYGSLDAFIRSKKGQQTIHSEQNNLDESAFIVTRKMFLNDSFPVNNIVVSFDYEERAAFKSLMERFTQETGYDLAESAVATDEKKVDRKRPLFEESGDVDSLERVKPSVETCESVKEEEVDNYKQARLSFGKNTKRVVFL